MENPDARTWLLFLHGNAATIASRVNIARYRELRALGLSIMAPEYRGFAGLPGIPSESGLNADARAAFDYLVNTRHVSPTRLVIYGWSLGSAVAVDLAAHVDESAVVLEGAMASVAGVGAQQYPFFPVRMIMRNRFESIQKVEHGRRLFAAARPPKRFVDVRGGHIDANDVDKAAFFGAIRSFLDEYGLLGHQE
jgi:pimeloyl-ACP methyl ester carboxylesterase